VGTGSKVAEVAEVAEGADGALIWAEGASADNLSVNFSVLKASLATTGTFGTLRTG
jgi:hypothetical protein